MFIHGIVTRPSSSVVAFVEPNSVRANYYNELLVSLGAAAVPIYQPEQFREMLEKERVDIVLVLCIDALHDVYIVPALEAGGECIYSGYYSVIDTSQSRYSLKSQ